MYRVQLTKNSVIKKPSACSIILVDSFESLKNKAAAKFQINSNKKPIRFFVARQCVTANVGIEICNDADIKKYFSDDIMIAVSNGENFKGKHIKYNVSSDLLQKISKPPRWPYPTYVESDVQDNFTNNITEPIVSNKLSEVDHKTLMLLPNNLKKMNGIFPILEGNVFNLIKKSVEHNDKIIINENDHFISFDYDDDTVFPDLNYKNDDELWKSSILRECRGLILSKCTGHVLARRFHKFFNINEKNETLFDDIFEKLLDSNTTVYEKLDGTLISPILLDDDTNTLLWATRNNISVEVTNFVNLSDKNYVEYVTFYLKNNITPLFEWCHDTNAVGVMCYPKKDLVLLCLRNNITGEYIYNFEDKIIPTFSITKQYLLNEYNILKIIEETKSSVGREGIVINVKSGEKYKLKSHWYVHMCQALKSGGNLNFLSDILLLHKSLFDIPSDKIWITVLQNNDDVIANCITILNDNNLENQSKEFIKFINIVKQSVKTLELQLKQWVIDNYGIVLSKDPLIAMAKSCGWFDTLVENALNKKSIHDDLIKFLINLAKKKQTHILQELLDIQWTNSGIDNGNTKLNICTFTKCDEKIKTHVLTTYFPKKIGNILGMKQIYDDTILNLPKTYAANEGKIIGMWEKWITDLRIDLQPSRKLGYTDHFGSLEYALFLVQYGNDTCDEGHGSFAGILVPTECDVMFKTMTDALNESFNTQSIIKIRRHHSLKINYKIFCDLDGVLVDFDKGVINATGRSPDEQTSSKMWNRIFNYPKFFETLDWHPHGKDLWNHILLLSKTNDVDPVILSGVPQGKKQYIMEKNNWCSKNLGKSFNVITCNSKEKYKYSAIGHILIDDNLENCKLWSQYSGTSIHHISCDRTIYELNKIYGNLNKISEDIFKFACDNPQILPPYESPHEIIIITNEWKSITSKVIFIDSEWNPDDFSKSISIIQIFDGSTVYIIDMINKSNTVVEQLYKLLNDKHVIKICFGMEHPEIFRIGTNIISLIDLQEVSVDMFHVSSVPSLSFATSVILNKKLNKSKEYQAGNWNIRPLPVDYLKYAKDDVCVLHDIYNHYLKMNITMPPKNMYLEHFINKKHNDDFDPNIPVELLYSGVFLSQSTRDELLKKIKPVHKFVSAHNVLLSQKPSERSLRGFPIGETVPIVIIGEHKNENVQIAYCKCLDNVYPIVISVNKYDYVLADSLIEYNTIDEFSIFGVVGVMVQEKFDELVKLPATIKNKILKFEKYALVGEHLKFKSTELTPSERSIVHEYSKNHNLSSESVGKGDNRKLTLTKKFNKIVNNTIITNDDCVTRKITDLYQYSIQKIIEEYNELEVFNIKGQLTDNNIVWNDTLFFDKLTSGKQLIILRGLPGSGKSTIVNYISSIYKCSSCSADDYFVVGEKYIFDKLKLNDAHEACYTKAELCMMNNNDIIFIDNTNVTKKEYNKYIFLASKYNYNVNILEIFCKNRDVAVKFALRNSHEVSINDILKMLSKWDDDKDAILITPYFKNSTDDFLLKNDDSLEKWLHNNKLYHFNKHRRHTHMHLEIGNTPLTLIDIPDDLMDEFYEKFTANPDEPKYIIEMVHDKFKLFFDVDYVDDKIIKENEIYDIVIILQNLLKSLDIVTEIYVTGYISNDIKTKTGMHFKCVDYYTTRNEIFKLRQLFIEKLSESYPDKNWNSIIDGEVYKEGRGIRILGCRKAKKGIDKGKIYKMLLSVDVNGNLQPDIKSINDINLLKKLSIL